jgi:hypothetical protein
MEVGLFETFRIPVPQFLHYFHALELGYRSKPCKYCVKSFNFELGYPFYSIISQVFWRKYLVIILLMSGRLVGGHQNVTVLVQAVSRKRLDTTN